MYVDLLTVARRSPERQWSELTSAPAWPDIEDALRALDGERTSLMTLGTGEGCMTIGGSHDGYRVWATFDSEHYQTAVDPNGPAEERPLHLNGQTRSCAAQQVVDRVVALRAARAFAIHGRLEPSLLWEAC